MWVTPYLPHMGPGVTVRPMELKIDLSNWPGKTRGSVLSLCHLVVSDMTKLNWDLSVLEIL